MNEQIIKERGNKMSNQNCNCCKNKLINRGIGAINAYWLQGKKHVYHICPECQENTALKAEFLTKQEGVGI